MEVVSTEMSEYELKLIASYSQIHPEYLKNFKYAQYFQTIGEEVKALSHATKAHEECRILREVSGLQCESCFYYEIERLYTCLLDSSLNIPSASNLPLQMEMYKELNAIEPLGVHLGDYAFHLHKRCKDYPLAKATYLLAIQTYPTHSSTLFRYAGFLRHIEHKDEEAKIYYQKAIEANPNNVEALGTFASYLHGIKADLDKAEELYLLAVRLDGSHVNNLCNYGLFLSEERKDYTQAEGLFQKALAISPSHANCLYNYAVMLDTQCQRKKEAEGHYRAVLIKSPHHAYTLYNLAQLLESFLQPFSHDSNDGSSNKNAILEIKELYATLIHVDGSDAVALADFGRFLMLYTDEFRKVEKLLLRALDLDNTSEVALYNLSLLHSRWNGI